MELLSVICYSYLLFNVQLLVREVGSQQPSWTKQPPSQLYVSEGENVTLTWTYNLQGTLRQAQLKKLGGVVVIDKLLTAEPTVTPDYKNRWHAQISNTETSVTIIAIPSSDIGTYEYELTNDKVLQNVSRVEILLLVPVRITNQVRGDQTVPEGKNLHLFCEATGEPTPINITWTKVLEDGSMSKVLHHGPTWNFTNINTTDSGTYLCTADNGFGNPVSGQAVKVIVTAPVKIVKFQREHIAALQESVTLNCEAKGNPPPTYSWTPCDPGQVCDNSTLVISQVLNDAVYTCKVANEFSSDARDTSVFIGGKVINITLVITSEDCTDGKYNDSSLLKRLSDTMETVLAGRLGYESTQLRSVRCGITITVNLALEFNSTTKEQDVISTLRNAVVDGKLGDFSVNPSSIKGIRPDVEKTTVTAPTTPASGSDNTWIIVGAVLGTVVVLAVIAIVGCCILKKKKFKRFKDPREVHSNEGEERTMEGDQEGGYAPVDRTYADVGPNANYRASNPSSVPAVTYEVAEKSASKGRTQRQEQAIPEYAMVDKTKKKKRTPKPGELQYADLGEFSGRETKTTMPRSSATDTVYADIKQ